MTAATQVQDVRRRLDEALDHYRARLETTFDGLSESELRRPLVPSRTTLLGLVKHLTYVERFYFEHSITGRSLQDIGVANAPDRSFVLTKADSISKVLTDYRNAYADSRKAVAELGLDETVSGRVEQPVVALYLRALHDLIQHCGHADILREQVLSAR